MNNENKMIIYQVFTRLFGNNNNHCVYNGDITANGCGKMADFTLKALGEIRKLRTSDKRNDNCRINEKTNPICSLFIGNAQYPRRRRYVDADRLENTE